MHTYLRLVHSLPFPDRSPSPPPPPPQLPHRIVGSSGHLPTVWDTWLSLWQSPSVGIPQNTKLKSQLDNLKITKLWKFVPLKLIIPLPPSLSLSLSLSLSFSLSFQENFGLDLLEVRDDGHGISEEDCSAVGLPHYTSKISDEGDLLTLGTYGFRGEALSSLCTMAEVTVTTRTESEDHARVYSLDSHGRVVETKVRVWNSEVSSELRWIQCT